MIIKCFRINVYEKPGEGQAWKMSLAESLTAGSSEGYRQLLHHQIDSSDPGEQNATLEKHRNAVQSAELSQQGTIRPRRLD